MILTSSQNPRIKGIRALSQRRKRQETGLFFAEGIRLAAEAVGEAGVILLGDTADPYDPAAVRGSMGSIFSQHIVRTSLEALVQWKHRFNVPIIGASDAAATDYRKADYAPPVLMCLGGEQHGLSKELLDACDTVVRIPMVGRADSLNLAVAAGVVLYEVFNRVGEGV